MSDTPPERPPEAKSSRKSTIMLAGPAAEALLGVLLMFISRLLAMQGTNAWWYRFVDPVYAVAGYWYLFIFGSVLVVHAICRKRSK